MRGAATRAEDILGAPVWSNNDEEHAALRREWLEHGKREAAIAGLYLETFGYPAGFAPYESREDELLGFMLHDIAKDEAVHPKKWRATSVNELTKNDLRMMKRHPTVAEKVLRRYETHVGEELPGAVFDVVLFHHETFNGRGYPHRLKQKYLGFYARLAACIDQVVGRREHRAYHKRTYSLRQAYEDAYRDAGRLYDKDMMDNLGKMFRENLHMNLPETQWLGEWV